MRTSPLLPVWLVIVVGAIAFQLGGPPLIDPDEGRNAEVAREMAETNDYVMPRLNGLPYVDKPIVYFAAAAAVMEIAGATELAARLPAFLFTLATAAVVFYFARRAWGGETPWIAAVVFLSMPLTIAFARTVIFDSALMFFVTVSLVAFYFAIDSRLARETTDAASRPSTDERRIGAHAWSVIGWAAMGLAMITKGPVTFLLVLAPAVPYAWKRKSVRVLFPAAGILVFAGIVAPWIWGVSQTVPDFLRYVLVTETAERMATDTLRRTGPPWYFVPYLIGGALPWSIVAIFSWRRLRDRDPAVIYWLLAFIVPFVFFSISQSKRPQYILPLMVPLALLVAHAWRGSRHRGAAVAMLLFGALLLVAPLLFDATEMRPEIAAAADDAALALGIASVIGGCVTLFARRSDLALVALSLPVILIPVVTNPLMHAIGERRSARSFVADLEPHVGASTRVIGVEAFTGSVPFYLERRMIVVTDDATELTSNYLMRRYGRFVNHPASPLRTPGWFERSLSSTEPRVYIVRRKDRVRQKLLESRGWQRVAEGARLVGYAQ